MLHFYRANQNLNLYLMSTIVFEPILSTLSSLVFIYWFVCPFLISFWAFYVEKILIKFFIPTDLSKDCLLLGL